jgi:hypothetical protein
MPLSIVEQDGRIAVSTPYHPNFPARARKLGGEWDAARRVWMFDAGDEARVRRLCQEIYGADGSEGAAPFPNPAEHGRNEYADGAMAPIISAIATACASGCSPPGRKTSPITNCSRSSCSPPARAAM